MVPSRADKILDQRFPETIMGGQNHQPTNTIRLIAPSACLSQKLGEGFVAVLQSNNELENAIIAAVDHLHVEHLATLIGNPPADYLDATVARLQESISKVLEIRDAYRHLLEAAAQENYRGNPLASKVESFNLASKFSGTLILPAPNDHAWRGVESRVKDTNILQTLEWESSEFEKLIEPTAALIAVIKEAKALLQKSGKRAFIEAVECNQIALRQHYARVFSMWNHLHAMFLYSALMMTELFYRSNGFQSLLEESTSSDASAVA
jgi:hypothetical protein